MLVIARPVLDEFCTRHPDAMVPLAAWLLVLQNCRLESPRHVQAAFATAIVLGGGMVVFNIAGGRYRLVTRIRYDAGVVLVKRVLA
jgi:mRNA interferase HigB